MIECIMEGEKAGWYELLELLIAAPKWNIRTAEQLNVDAGQFTLWQVYTSRFYIFINP